MKYKLFKQLPKQQRKGIEGTLSVGTDKIGGLIANFFQDETLIAELYKPDIVWINLYGIYLRGYEPAGIDVHHRQKFVYQEWFCAYMIEASQ